MPAYFFHLIIAMLGLMMGSFASVIIHRLHAREKGIFGGRSKCPSCQNTLRAIDLVPLASYVWNRFRCHFCKQPIAATYPLLEIVMGSLFALTAVMVGSAAWKVLIFWLAITFVLVTVSFYDILFREIPDEIMLPTIAISLFAVPWLGIHSWQNMTIGLIIPLLFFGGLFLGSRGCWLGGGDVRIGVLMGIVLGWPNILTGMFIGYLSGSLFSLFGIALKKLHRKSAIAFGPFLALGTYIALFWGQAILEWYWRTI